GGLTWCGTLCASIGLAARWTYWLATATIILGTLQLTYWSFVWVIRPILIVAYALTRYVLGHGSWEAVLRGSGELPYEVKWVGPRGQQPWAVNYVQDQVRGRGEQQLPYDLLVTDGVAVARVSRPGREEEQTPRHDLSETESEEDENPCQADAIGWKEGRDPPAQYYSWPTRGLTWEEIAGIPDEDLRRKAVSLKKAATTPESNQLPSGAPEPPAEPALYTYLDSRMRGSSHATALSQAATGRWSYAEGAQRLKEAARKHWSQLPNDSPPSIRQYVWELAQSGAERPASGEGAGWGCDTLRVTLCPGVVGKELYHALRIAGTQARPQLRRIEFPCNIQNRHSYGFAALQLGGKTLATIPDYCLSAGDFPLTSEEDFDNFGGTPDLKLEKKGRYPNTLTSWFRAALREAWAFSCIFGEEYYAPLEKAASHLLRLGEQHSYAWTATAVYSAWEELWASFCEEARQLDRRVRREMKDETPT
ncbi:unnamed protein product, partial [Symbiodinium necroappetens]